MNPHSKRPLFFTPRSPWGGRLETQSFRRHMRASEDRKPDPASKEMQGLAGQMAPNLRGASDSVTTGNTGKIWDVPHYDERDHPQAVYPAPQANIRPPATPGMVRYDSSQDRKAEEKRKLGFEGTAEGSKVGPERTDVDAELGKKFPAGAEPPKADEDFFHDQRHGPTEQRERDKQREYDERHIVKNPPFAFPPQQQPAQPVSIPAFIPDTFKPRKKQPPPPSTLLPYEQR